MRRCLFFVILSLFSNTLKAEEFSIPMLAERSTIGEKSDQPYYIGETRRAGFGYHNQGSPLGPYYVTFGVATITVEGSVDYSVVNDGCTGTILLDDQTCMIDIDFTPRAKGQFAIYYNVPYTKVFQNAPSESGILGHAISGIGILALLDPDPNPPPPPKQKCVDGSIVRLDAQSLGENVPIVGTGFFLSYSTEFAEHYQTNYFLPRGMPFFNYGGWNINVHHYFDQTQYRLFFGSGTSEFNNNFQLSGTNISVVGSDGAEVYIFDKVTGKHLETLHGSTGAVKYSFTYDASDRLASITDAYGNQTLIGPNVNAFTITSYGGKVTSITLDSGGLISSVTNPNGESYLMTYAPGTDLIQTFTKPGGQVSTFTYSSTGRLAKDLSAAGNFWQLSESLLATMRQVSKSSQMGRTSVITSRHEAGKTIRETTSEFGYVETSSSNLNGSMSWEENSDETIVRAFGNDLRLGGFNFTSSLAIEKNNLIRETLYTRVYDPVQPSSFFDYDSVTDSSTINGKTTTRFYSTNDRTAITTSASGATVTEVFNNFEDLVSFRIGNDTAWTYSYDSRGRLENVVQGGFNSVSKTYNSAGFLASTTNGRNETTSFVYDLAGRVTQVIRPDSSVIGYSYDPNGNLTGITPPGRVQHAFEFNVMELMSKYDPPVLTGVAVTETQYNYNLDKQLTSVVRPDMQSVLYTYGTTSGLLNKISISRGDIDYTYHNNNNLVSRIDSADGVRNEYTYNGRDLKSVTQKRSSDNFHFADFNFIFDGEHRKIYRAIRGGSYPLYAYIGYSYNNDDKPTLIGSMSLSYSYPSGRLSTTTLDKISDSRTYDSLGNLESYTAYYNPTGGPQQVLYSYSLTRDVMSRIIGKTETIQGVTSTYDYTYDVVGRLIGVLKNSVPYSSYVYDDNGNRTGGMVNGVPFTATYDAQDRLLSYNGRIYSYNANGDITQIQWDPNTQSSFTYDALGKLISSVSTAGVNFGYSMDGEGNIVRFSQNGSTMVRYIYEDPYRIAGEFTDLGQMYRQYVYGTSVNTPDYTIDATGNNRFIKDHLGSPRLIVNASNGTIMQRMDYDEFGKVITNTNPTYQPYGFAGGIYLRNTGLVKFGARYYDPEVGRWTTKDPILFDGGDSNLYSYAQNDPINFRDPNGKSAVGLILGGLCAVYDAYDTLSTLNDVNNFQNQLNDINKQISQLDEVEDCDKIALLKQKGIKISKDLAAAKVSGTSKSLAIAAICVGLAKL